MTSSEGFASDLASFVGSLHAIPPLGANSARNRARPLRDYDHATRSAISAASDLIDAEAATAIWETAMAASPHEEAPVWVHGDLEGNCLVDDGRLSGIVDWRRTRMTMPCIAARRRAVHQPASGPAGEHEGLRGHLVIEFGLAARDGMHHQRSRPQPVDHVVDRVSVAAER